MTVNPYLRTKDLAQAVHISVQQVRNYEANGFLPAVERSPSGYRRYTQQHLVALKTARHLIGGYGWQRAQQIMQAVHQGKLSQALALIDERHAELARTRLQLEQTLAALSVFNSAIAFRNAAALFSALACRCSSAPRWRTCFGAALLRAAGVVAAHPRKGQQLSPL